MKEPIVSVDPLPIRVLTGELQDKLVCPACGGESCIFTRLGVFKLVKAVTKTEPLVIRSEVIDVEFEDL